MFRPSIRRKIVGIALGLIILMAITSVLSIMMARTVGHLLDEFTNKYIPAYSHLTKMNVRSLERALALRRMVIAKMQIPPDEGVYAARLKTYEELAQDVDREAAAARRLIVSIIEDTSTPSDNAALARLDARIESAVNDIRRHLTQERTEMLSRLEAQDFAEVRRILARVDVLRDEFNQRIDAVRADMLAQVGASAATVIRDQKQAILVSATVTALAAIVGLIFAVLVSTGITRPVRRLLEGTKEVEAGYLEGSVTVTTRDEIGQLSQAFNYMVDQLRRNQRIRETFGRYIDPQIVEGLIDKPSTAAEGQRRVMTVLFCDMKGFTELSEGMTPQGLVKVMNRYLSAMSQPIRAQGGIIDKYIGDAIMAYWGPPFVDEADQAKLACRAALDMIGRIEDLRSELPELLGVRNMSLQFDIRIGIATGEALVGSIGSELMMSYTLMGDTVNLASRLEGANKFYGTRSLASEHTFLQLSGDVETREIDRLVVVGQPHALTVYELLAPRDCLTGQQRLLRSLYAEGLAAYRARVWDDAERAFRAALETDAHDEPSKVFLDRISYFKVHPPAPDWDGSWHLDSK